VSGVDVLDRFTWLKNSSFLYDGDSKVYLDPWGVPDGAPQADVIFVTHAHDDHFSAEDIEKVRADHTRIATTADVAKELSGSIETVSPGDALELAGISVDVVPAYNSAPDRQNFHPKANNWVGYVFTLEGTRIYHSGDTDAIPEMEAIDCDIAFLPIGGTYTMTAEEAVDAVHKLGPKIVVPMHYGFVAGTPKDMERFKKLVPDVTVRSFEPTNPFDQT
jgi:L-ascorbate metabolism protein UlaG (beta-lactamase superfamily)